MMQSRQREKKNNGAHLGFEETLWLAADKLRGHMDAAEYKHVVLGLIFLKYISDAFEERRHQLEECAADPANELYVLDPADRMQVLEDRDEYASENVFWVPIEARWSYLQANAKQPNIGKLIDDAMVAIEKDNPPLKGVLPKDYARPTLDKQRLGELIDLIGTIGLGDKESRSKDILGRVYEYFLSKFASAEGKNGGEFYTPQSVVKLLVEMIEPYKGRVFDPCCGSGGMFVQSEKFVQIHGGRLGDLSIYGQESNATTWRLAKMNLAIRKIDTNLGSHNADSFHDDLHKDLKADYILANPPFNDSDWGGDRLREDARWRYGTPPVKSLSMVFYAGKIIRHSAMQNPTLVVLTDRNDLDDQLFGTFALCQDTLRQAPVQAESREHIQKLLQVASGGVVFTTIQKFLPEQGREYPSLSHRRNIVVIADEAHRSQYDFIDGFARHMHDALPNASFIGFTGTPIEQADRSTPAVFGEYIDVYDIQQSVEDGATVRIYYEGRLAKLELDEREKPQIDPEFEEVTEGKEPTVKDKLRSKWARLEAIVGTNKRISLIAKDIVEHFERRLEAIEGKAMIVCMSRRICVDLYSAIIQLRPEWHSEDDGSGAIKVVMTGSAADRPEWQQHIRNKSRREALAKRFKDPRDPLKLVIVRDMWLTGFDAPCLHTMYLDKPMRGHGLMQAIARVNRVFKDKPGGLVVDYLGIADQLKRALADYTERDRAQAGIPQEEAVAILLEKYEIILALFHGFDYSLYTAGAPAQRLSVIPAAMEHILRQENGKKRFLQVVTELSQAFVLAVPHDQALAIRDEVGFFQTIRAAFMKATPTEGKTQEELDTAVRQIVSKAVAAGEVIDIFAAIGLKSPDISILSDEFLQEVRGLPQRNLALELLEKLLKDELKIRSRKNLVQARSFGEMLERSIHQYQNRSIETAQIIAELIALAKEMRQARNRGEGLGLTEDELAFYDALEVNDSAVKILGDETLRTIARELVTAIRQNLTIDWTVKESVRAKLRSMVKRLLRKYKYPPDKQEKAVQTILEQAELLCKDWAT